MSQISAKQSPSSAMGSATIALVKLLNAILKLRRAYVRMIYYLRALFATRLVEIGLWYWIVAANNNQDIQE